MHAARLQALGLGIDKQVSVEIVQSLNTGDSLLKQLMPVVLCTLRYPTGGVCMACAPFLTAHLARLKNAARRQNGAIPDDAKQGLLLILEVRGKLLVLLGGLVCLQEQT
jgi:hypothetical protein